MATAREREAAAKGALGYSAWDRSAQLHYEIDRQAEPEPIDIEAVRCERRIAMFEHAMQSPELVAGTELEEVYKSRLRYLGHGDVMIRGLRRHLLQRIGLCLLISGSWIYVCISTGVRLGGMIALPAIAADYAYCWWFGVSRNRVKAIPVKDAVDARKCPDCHYDLRGALPGVAEACVGGIDVGPRHCPECGSVWPLLPPCVERLIASGRVGTPPR
jgi:hypothetical protein